MVLCINLFTTVFITFDFNHKFNRISEYIAYGPIIVKVLINYEIVWALWIHLIRRDFDY